MDTSGELLFAANGIATPTGQYAVSEHEDYQYPIDGAWYYCESEAAALVRLSLAPVPPSVPKLWLIRALRQLDLKAMFDAWLASQSDEIREDWAACTEIRRNDPLTEAAKQAPLSLTDEQIDQIWRLANSLGQPQD